MKISSVLNHSGFSLEFFPPKTDAGEKKLFSNLIELENMRPRYVSVTYGAGGSSRERTQRIVKKIASKEGWTVMAHLTCIGHTHDEIAEIIDDYRESGIQNIMALRGDTPKGTNILPEDGDFPHASDLVRFIRQRSGDYFSIGVAAFPEKHPESLSFEKDIEMLKYKIDNGADFAVTQMFFDNRYFYELIDRAQKAGISVPIVPGMMPITNIQQIKTFAELSGAKMPDALLDKLEKHADDPADVFRIGVDYTIEQCSDLLNNGFQFLHIFTLNQAKAPMEIFRALSEISVAKT